MFRSLVKSIVYAHHRFRIMMENEFFLALVLWALLTGLFSIPVGFAAVYFTPVEQMYMVRHVMQAYLVITVGYFVYTGFGIMYENYCNEQQRIIDRLSQR